jgi:hypothetical protein
VVGEVEGRRRKDGTLIQALDPSFETSEQRGEERCGRTTSDEFLVAHRILVGRWDLGRYGELRASRDDGDFVQRYRTGRVQRDESVSSREPSSHVSRSCSTKRSKVEQVKKDIRAASTYAETLRTS